VTALRHHWSAVPIALRADGGFAIPALYAACEQHGISDTSGLIPNRRLEWAASPLLVAAPYQRDQTGAGHVRFVGEVRYQADSWPQPRRVVSKAEVLAAGINPRCVVTNRPDPPEALYDAYGERGETQHWITDLQRACAADRLSGHGFWTNQLRLLLHATACWLLDTERRWLCAQPVARMQ
jgi:hypothetical protein